MLLVPKARRLNGTHLEVALGYVRCQCVDHLCGTWRNDEQALALLDDWLKDILQLQDVMDLSVTHQHHHILEHTLITLVVVDEVR